MQKESEGEYMVIVPALPGCISQGDTVNEAIEMAREAIEIYIEEIKSRGETIPDDTNTLEYSVHVESA